MMHGQKNTKNKKHCYFERYIYIYSYIGKGNYFETVMLSAYISVTKNFCYLPVHYYGY